MLLSVNAAKTQWMARFRTQITYALDLQYGMEPRDAELINSKNFRYLLEFEINVIDARTFCGLCEQVKYLQVNRNWTQDKYLGKIFFTTITVIITVFPYIFLFKYDVKFLT